MRPECITITILRGSKRASPEKNAPMRKSYFKIKNMTRGKLPSLPFKRIKEEVVGVNYEVSLVCIGTDRSRHLNKKYRNKDAPANILTFPLDTSLGEIFITPPEAKKDAPKFGRSYKQFLADLFIHGLFHLKGDTHSSSMKIHEARVRRKFHLE